jgi:hypothetical protein
VVAEEESQISFCCKGTIVTQHHENILYFFSSVAHVWEPGAKTTGLIVKKFAFYSI